ncbi:VWA domain-containing protein [Pokkaliibacter sp. CJK22405]|uniref:VWA domain-containing protein n=1 Tax=Pokkaliibacter sp. CJK22405 TaxID=3384615 RepID=UPI00398546B0
MRVLRSCCIWLVAGMLSLSIMAAQAAPTDVRLLIDVSGSMQDNDPQNLRAPAVRLLAQLLPNDAQAGFWTFGNKPEAIAPHGAVTEEWRKAALASATKITSADEWTDIEAALKQAIEAPAKDGIPKNIILLSDGMVDLDPDTRKSDLSRKAIIDDLLPQLIKAGYHVHTIALSSTADRDLLQTLSKKTNGLYEEARNAYDLSRIFAKILGSVAPVEEAPLDENNQFKIDRSITEFTALIFRNGDTEPKLKDPNGLVIDKNTKASNVRWQHEPNYDIATIKAPKDGEWTLMADVSKTNKVAIVSDFRLDSKPLPATALIGQPINLEFWFSEDDKRITNETFHKIMNNSLRVYYPDAHMQLFTIPFEAIDQKTWAYNYPLTMLNQTGSYEIKLVVDGGTFRRQIVFPLTITAPLEITGKADTSEGQARIIVEARPDNDELVPESSKISVRSEQGGQETSIPLNWDPEKQRFVGEFKPQQQGKVVLKADVNAAMNDGKTLNYEAPPVEVELSVPDAPVVQNEASMSSVGGGMGLGDSGLGLVTESADSNPTAVKVTNEAGETVELAAPEKPAEEAPATIEEEGGTNWLFYGSVAAVNLLLILGGIFGFRALMKRKRREDAADDGAEV